MKRNVFEKLVEGFDALAEQRQGKATLRSHKLQVTEVAPLTADELVKIREHSICHDQCSP